ncbi:trifunctional serine/threonine-protein kinase/ATP-binding protein/sensor histidine kinase [Archangium violaceum]|uniref:trifunctional serine/threonine-protein kinase/ATP-binding protein/sensor histidine kinase n=1 Tax=Archangium violaceum TaxID=83451 RepID=UPI0036D9F9C2
MNPIAGYSVRDTLFTSTKSIIYRATRTADLRPVILKVLGAEFPGTEEVARLHREYRLTQALAMEGVIEVLALERYGTSVAIVLEDFGAESLARLLAGRPMELPRFLELALRLAEILGRVHRRHVIHKDINPSNVVWNPSTDELKLIDFGIATELSRETPALLGLKGVEGSLPYVSPEATGRMNRTVDYRTDFYSLGVTLYELLTGQLPFTSTDPMELVHSHIARVPVSPSELVPDVPAVVSELVLRLMSKRAEDRYQSAGALVRDLQRCLEELRATGGISSFEVGRGDVSERLQLPQKLYGRQRESEELLASFERVAGGRAELVLVAGYAGIGKSSLVHEVHRPIVQRRGHFISGKFEQFNRNIPYASLIQAIQELVRQLLSEPAEQLVHWREKLLAALGSNASVILEVSPEVELIVGPQPKAPELPPVEAQHRFMRVFEAFVRTFARPEHPLVMFLDDLQWADSPSLALIEQLMTDPDMRHLLLIGAYRDTELDAAHPLLPALAGMSKAGASVSTITLGPLQREHCLEFLADALNRALPEVEPLADICLRKTDGNPFFVGQFLFSLYNEGMLRFDSQAGGWTWDMERISHTPMTDNVVALMESKIQKLPGDAQRIIKLAACVGGTFELKSLALIDGRSARETADSLWAGLREGLILPLGDAYKFIEDQSAAADLVTYPGDTEARNAGDARVSYRFLHDRVQQAAWSLIPDKERCEIHLRLGRLMRSGLTAAEQGEALFAIVGHLNLGSELIGQGAEREELAELNLAAGRKAQASAAHAAALGYFEAGLALLGNERWTRCYELALPLHTQAMEASFLSRDLQRMEHHATQVLAHARGPLEQCKVHEVRIRACIIQNRLEEAVLSARQVLTRFGVGFPEQPTPEDVRAALLEARAAIGDRPIEALIELPPMTDPVMLAVSRLLTILAPAAYVSAPPLFPLVVLRQVALAAKHGNTGALAYGYAMYGVILLGAVGDIDTSYAFGKLALRVLERYEAREFAARAHFMWNMLSGQWKTHIRESLRGLQEVFRMGLEVGDLEFAGRGANWYVIHSLFMGQELAELDRSAGGWVQAVVQCKQDSAAHRIRIVHQTVQNLRGLSEDPCRLVGAVYDEAEMLPIHLAANDALGLAALSLYKLQLCVLFGRHAEGLGHADAVARLVGAVTATLHLPIFFFFDALTRLALHGGMSAEQREPSLKRVDEEISKMKEWAGHAPMNYGAKHALLMAERHRVLGAPEQARAEYYRAIALAREHEFRNDEALATELFAAFLREHGEQEVAWFFLTKARHLYHLWGAEAKVRELDRAFPELRTLVTRGGVESRPPSTSVSTNSEESSSSQALDMVSVLKASQTISGEVVLTALLEKLVRIVVENAGARWGLLLLEGERPLVAVAHGSSRDGVGAVSLHEGIEQVPVEFSRAIVRYVERTQEVVVLGDAAGAGAFQSEAYVLARRPKSVLCMPILHQKKRVGVLYLENELLANAFTPERCGVLEMLAAQAAISLENAKLYETLDARVKDRTRELSEALQRLRETQTQLILQEKLAALGSLTSGIAHELKNPLNFVNNFAGSAVALVSELREELHPRRARPAGAGDEGVEQLLGELSTAAEKIVEHGGRVDRIIRAMLEHSRSGSGLARKVDINALVREYVNLAMVGHDARKGSLVLAVRLHADYDEALGSEVVTPEELGRVILNLANNALYALELEKRRRGEAFLPVLGVTTRNLETRFEIRIRDNGGGIQAELRNKIFTPFFTTKPPGAGTGLGLSISHDIVVQGHGGTLAFSSEEGAFTEFVVTLPKRELPAQAAR